MTSVLQNCTGWDNPPTTATLTLDTFVLNAIRDKDGDA